MFQRLKRAIDCGAGAFIFSVCTACQCVHCFTFSTLFGGGDTCCASKGTFRLCDSKCSFHRRTTTAHDFHDVVTSEYKYLSVHSQPFCWDAQNGRGRGYECFSDSSRRCTSRSKSETMRCVLLNASYSASAFFFAAAAEMRPLSGRMS